MTVVDTNIIVNLMLRGNRTQQAETALKLDSLWYAPILWRSEFCTVLALHLRKELITKDDAFAVLQQALRLMQGKARVVDSLHVIELTAFSKCSAYDCKFVALAQEMSINLATLDRQILDQFPETTISLDQFISP
jgi:predicted nucleic acid-binding protein